VGPLAAPAVFTSAVSEVRNAPAPPVSTADPSAVLAPALPGAASRRASWSDSVAVGDYGLVIRDAERRGVASVLIGSPLADLVALADAARLSGRIELGKRALSAERSRFPRTSAANDAAFFLGRIADDQEHALTTALTWYETYLAEAPQGHFAAEAFGRRMVAISRQSGRAAARQTAVEYLKRFAGGPHAALARDLLSD
jgi:TolA-binding protein